MEHSQVDVGGLTLHVVQRGQGKPVLFLHGFPDVWIGWRSQMEAVADAGYRAIAIDMRGYGKSDGPDDVTGYSPLQTVGDLVGLLRQLDLPSVTLVGHDFGAVIAWYATMMRPDLFTAVFGMSVPYLPVDGPSQEDIGRASGHGEDFYWFKMMRPEADAEWADARITYPSFLYWSSGSPTPEEQWDMFESRAMYRPAPVACPPWADPDEILYAVGEFERTGFHRPLNYYRASAPFFAEGRAFKGVKITQPSYFLAGDADAVIKVIQPTEDMLRQNVPGLKGMTILPGIGHWVHREAPAETNAALLSFLSSLG